MSKKLPSSNLINGQTDDELLGLLAKSSQSLKGADPEQSRRYIETLVIKASPELQKLQEEINSNISTLKFIASQPATKELAAQFLELEEKVNKLSALFNGGLERGVQIFLAQQAKFQK